MTYKTRQEVLRAAADWTDVCEAAGVPAKCKCNKLMDFVSIMRFDSPPECYEFPIALLEGKEVWVGSELYTPAGEKVYAHTTMVFGDNYFSWNPPKPKTVMVEMVVADVEELYRWFISQSPFQQRIKEYCKKALEKFK